MRGHWRFIGIHCHVVSSTCMTKKYLPEILVLIGEELFATNPVLIEQNCKHFPFCKTFWFK